jgi:hypothetical protein
VEALRHCDRAQATAQLISMLTGARTDVGPVEQSRILLANGLTVQSFSARALAIEPLREARRLAADAGEPALELRCASELMLGLGWAGQVQESLQIAEYVRSHPLRNGSIWMQRMVVKLDALSAALAGDFLAGANGLMDVGAREVAEDITGDSMSSFRVAAALYQLIGDHKGVAAALTAASEVPLTRFNGFSHAGIAHERARLALATNSPDVGQLLSSAVEMLARYGDLRVELTARCERARWLKEAGDEVEANQEFAACAEGLIRSDPPTAGVALAYLAHSIANQEPSLAQEFADAAVALSEAGRGVPLTAEEKLVIDSVRAFGSAEHSAPAEEFDTTRLKAMLGEFRSGLG